MLDFLFILPALYLIYLFKNSMRTFRKSYLVHKSTKDGSNNILYVYGNIVIPETQKYVTKERLLLDTSYGIFGDPKYITEEYEQSDSAKLNVESINVNHQIDISNILYTIHQKFAEETSLYFIDGKGCVVEKSLSLDFIKKNTLTIIAPYTNDMFAYFSHKHSDNFIIEINKRKGDIIMDIDHEYTVILTKVIICLCIIAFRICY